MIIKLTLFKVKIFKNVRIANQRAVMSSGVHVQYASTSTINLMECSENCSVLKYYCSVIVSNY